MMEDRIRESIARLESQGVRFLDKPPDGWHRLTGATTAPNGWEWWGKGSRFFGAYENALVRKNPKDSR